MKIFSKDAYWEELFQLEDIVDEADNPTFSNPRAPTIEGKDAKFIPVKHNFAEVFDRPVFAGKVTCVLKYNLYLYLRPNESSSYIGLYESYLSIKNLPFFLSVVIITFR